ncbi:SDR family NAD(P)-dependent oxidoreductase [Cellulosimicrobium marinum]|uniref:SDR family NAD(P)-dependent oxidoreductase n=1 Tax=Cellulosimicrobium marinum TaxID=1638992 RepID=UPI001E551480|nr:SDR family NAD(P)-dependent oxidoreductase [Cellulosimicrobium marinum]MCB7135810.1 SDR family oxidoreductase [Cellulosimicrobium marinum]
MVQVAGSVVVVTGGGNGIGREVVLQLLGKGAHVVALDLSEVGLKETRVLAGTHDDRLSTRVVDVTDHDAVDALAADVVASHGHVDGVVNVAGIIQRFVPVAQLERREIEKVVAVNFWGVVNVTTAFLPHLQARPAASLVNVASMGALVPFPGQSAYGASKAAVKLFTEGLQAEHEGTDLAVSIVFPGAIGTEITKNSGVETPGGKPAAEAAAESAHRTTSPVDAARQIVAAVEKGTPRVRIGKDAVMLDRLARLMPSRSVQIIARKMRSLVS